MRGTLAATFLTGYQGTVISAPRTIVVVGAGLAGLRTCESLRQQGYDGRLVLAGAEEHPPYSRPPLSKQVLRGEDPPESAALRRPDEYDGLGLDLRLGAPATDLDLGDRSVGLAGGERLRYDRLVVATGATPHRLPGTDGLAGVHVLRTLDDCVTLRTELARGPRVVVVGAGFIGGEVAASARSMGLDVTMVEQLPVPLGRVLGEQVGRASERLHADHGVHVRCGVGVTAFGGSGRVERVCLSDGTSVDADVVVVGVGVRPATGWLASSGLRLDDGVVCDETCRASAPDVFAVGDVARWHNPLFGESMRLEHWTNANEQAVAVARAVLGGPQPFAPVPYFWSDLYDTKVQSLGLCGVGDDVQVVHGSLDEPRFVALYRRGDRLVGVVGFSSARLVMRYRPLLAASATWDDALAAAG